MPKLLYALHAAENHWFPGHPECPQRVTAIQAALERLEAFQGAEVRRRRCRRHSRWLTGAAARPAPQLDHPAHPPLLHAAQVQELAGIPAELPNGLLAAVHTAEHVEQLRATSARLGGPTTIRDPDDPGRGLALPLQWMLLFLCI